jgi:SSS family solute:Na+ symporter
MGKPVDVAINYGLAASLLAYVVASLLTTRTPADVLRAWDDRLAGRDAAVAERVAS